MTRLSHLVLFAMLFAAITLPASEILAGFSLQDYEGGLQLGLWRGSLEGGYQFEDNQSSSSGTSFTLSRNRFDEVAEIANEGFYLIDPRFLAGSAGLDLDFFQDENRGSAGSGSYSDGTLWGYRFDTALFPQWPENVAFFANRNQGVSNTNFGGQTNTTTSGYGLVARVLEDSVLKDHGIYYFSSSLSAREQESDEETTQLGEKYQLDQQRDEVDYTAEKGFQTADLKFRYQFDNERNTGTSRSNFQTQQFQLDYSKDFGLNLNRTWSSAIYYYTRNGTGGEQQNLFVDESLHIQHYENLSTDYLYQLQYNDNADQGATVYQFAQFVMNHRWYENFSQALNVAGTRQDLPNGNTESYWIGGTDSYSRGIPWNGSFFLDTNGQYEVTDNNLTSSQIQVIDESHLATTTPFTLNNTFVIAATIVVVDTRGGSRLPCELNVDYLVSQLGNLTQILVVPTSFVIKPGDPLAISYTYQVPANARYSTTTKNVTVGVRFPLIDMSYAYQSIDQSLLSGEGAQFLVHTRSNTFNLGVHHAWEGLEAHANAMYQEVDSSNVSFDMTDLSQYLSYHAPWRILLGLTGDETFTDYTSPRHRTKSYSFQLNGDRALGGTGTASLYASLHNLEDSEFPTQKEIETGLRINFTFGKLRIAPTVLWYDRTWSNSETRDLRFEIRVTRLFY